MEIEEWISEGAWTAAFCEGSFMLLEKGAKTEVLEIFERYNLTPNVHFTTWDDCAIMSMVQSGFACSQTVHGVSSISLKILY